MRSRTGSSGCDGSTVEDVFIGCISSTLVRVVSRQLIMRAAKLWLTQHTVLKSMKAEAFFAQPDTFGWSAASEFLHYWAASVVQKFIKFAASEYAYFHLPTNAGTEWLTSMTAALVNLEHLQSCFQQQLQELTSIDSTLPWQWGEKGAVLEIFTSLLFVLIYYNRPAIAVRAMEPVFVAILEQQEDNFTVLPKLLSYFLPHMSFQGIAFEDRVAMVADQLILRGFRFSVAFTCADTAAAATDGTRSAPVAEVGLRSTELATMSVQGIVQHVRHASSASGNRALRIRSVIERIDGETSDIDGLTFSKYLSVVIRECRSYYDRCRQACRRQVKSSERLLVFQPSDVQGVMRRLQKMLRFGSPYYEYFVQMGVWSDILRSDGWVPVHFIEQALAVDTNSAVAKLPSKEKLEIVETLLRQHNNFQRFQIGYCPLRHSPFHGQRCARSMYAHEIRSPPLYRQIICQSECLVRPGNAADVGSLPLFGWVALSERPHRALSTHPSLFPLFDNIPFFVVMPPEAIGSFREYEERTPKLRRYDQKLRKSSLWFAEVYLRAIARDGQAMTGEADDGKASSHAISAAPRAAGRGHGCHSIATAAMYTEVYTRVQDESDSAAQRWYVFPQYYAKKVPKVPARQAGGDCERTLKKTSAASDSFDPLAEAQGDDFIVCRHCCGRAPCLLGLPKLFFTGRVAQLRELHPTEVSRHDARCEGESTVADGAAPCAGSCTFEADEGAAGGLVREDAAPDSSEAGGEGAEGSTDSDRPKGLQGRRGTPHEFCVAVGDSAGRKGVRGEQVNHPAALCEYAIAPYCAPSSLLPSVVVRVRRTGPAAASVTSAICLSATEEASEYYRRSFPPPRVQLLFADYVAEAMAEVIMRTDDNSEDAQCGKLAAARNGNGAVHGQQSERWGGALPASLLPPSLSAAALSDGDVARSTFDVAPLLRTLKAFTASKELSCVLNVRVRTPAGVSLSGCRQGVAELKTFAREMGLQYSLIARQPSQESAACERDGSTVGKGSGGLSPPSRLRLSDKSTEVLDVEQYEFRKRVSWSARDLKRILSELQLQPTDIPLTTLTDALTRECEDRGANYELLEFIGDAVMDFLVIADACLLSNAARQRGVPSDTSCCSQIPLSPRTLVPQEKWKPAEWCVPLPRHCWLDERVALQSVMENSVTATVCRNLVIAELLPPTASRHFDDEHYPHLRLKVRADIFEAILGAAYRSRLGLDRIRHVLRRLFSFLPAAVRTARAAGTERAAALFDALLRCPYIVEGDGLRVEQLFSYRTTQLFEAAPQLLEAAVGSGVVSANTHLASSFLPRIQGKEFASVFTTGSPGYSYRRLHYFDWVRLHNRILHLFSEHRIGYVNEIITSTTHLVLDLDKVNPRSWGLLSIIWDWYQQNYRCPAAGFALDSSGVSVVTGKWKDSCHVHFPQVTVSVETWASLVEHIRAAVVIHLTEKETRLRDSLMSHAADYRVWLHRKALAQAVYTAGGQPQPHMWDYCDAASLLELSRTSRAVRLSVLEHVLYATQTLPGLASFAEVSNDADVFFGDWRDNEDMVVLERRGGAPPRHRLIVPLQWANHYFVLARNNSSNIAPPVFESKEFWESAIDQGLIKSKKLRLYLNDKCDTKYGSEHRPLVLDTLLVVSSHKEHLEQQRGAPCGSGSSSPCTNREGEEGGRGEVALQEARKRPMGAVAEWLSRWPNERVVHYHSQRHNQPSVHTIDAFCARRWRLAHARREMQRRICCTRAGRATKNDAAPRRAPLRPPSPSRWITPVSWDYDGPFDDPSEGWVVECAHSSILTLSSLRTCEYRGTDQKVYSSWVDCAPASMTECEAQRPTSAPLFSQEGTSDVLASFEDVYEHRVDLPGRLKCTSWTTWLNACVLRAPHASFKQDFKINAWSPAWWAFDPLQRTTTLYVATEPVLRLTGTDSLAAALAPPSTVGGGGGGMERFAQLFIPHLSYANVTPLKLSTVPFGPYLFPLFPDTSRKRMEVSGPTSAAAAVPSPALSREVTLVSCAAPVEDLTCAASSSSAKAVDSATCSGCVLAPVPAIVALPGDFPTSAPALAPALPAASPAIAWVRRAIHYVFSSTAARSEIGCLPLVLCESNDGCHRVRAELCAGGASCPLRSLPFVLSLQDMERVYLFVKTAYTKGGGRRMLRHMFVVADSDVEGPAVPHASVPLTKRLQALWDLLQPYLGTCTKERPLIYVSSDAVCEQLRRSLNPSGLVL
ncbi:hypothetical protein LSCM1_06033 [Leishmania martiniquensis]|uniref:RNase III domain-containing protein n=1 Tax=Leishmania martiniquensis TaxID=1580590 RepID=A0A836HKS3_9TRYP|nr:hypothetical protein LSCM1_06033 [Leishmania martiniquensis]